MNADNRINVETGFKPVSFLSISDTGFKPISTTAYYNPTSHEIVSMYITASSSFHCWQWAPFQPKHDYF